MPRKRRFTAFNLSFLDIMSCGFGAVVLVFLIIDHAIVKEAREQNADLWSEAQRLDEAVREGRLNLVQLRNTIEEVDFDLVEAQGRARRLQEEIQKYQSRAVLFDGATGEPKDLDAMKAQVRELEEEVERLRAIDEAGQGVSARSFVGQGNRQYLTGLKLGGKRIAILLDASASMLAEDVVNIIRLRNMDGKVKRRAPKWRRAVETVSWLTAQLPAGSQYQIYTFNTDAEPALEGTRGQWLQVAEREQLDDAVAALDKISPKGGTSLEKAFLSLSGLSPRPDNLFLITDGLPTQGISPPRRGTIKSGARQALFDRARRALPAKMPVNVILLPMEGDPMAAAKFWQLAQSSRGSFLTPAEDWP